MMRKSILFATIFALAGTLILSSCSNNQQTQNPLSVKITSPIAGETASSSITFQAETSNAQGELKEIRWDFGDGQNSTSLQGMHQYKAGGEFHVRVTVKDSQNRTASDEVVIKIAQGPSAMATVHRAANPNEPGTLYLSDEAPLNVQFSSQASKPGGGGTLTGYHWEFGNGDESNEPNPVYTYNETGEHIATLTITDNVGKTSQATVTVRVITYEPVKAMLPLESGSVEYHLYSKNARNLNTGPSLFLQYIVDASRKLSEQEIRAVLDDIVSKAQQRPRVARISVQLFDRIKSEFMVPREYAHYLGALTWDRLEEQPSFSVNRRYLDGTAAKVLSIGIMENMLTSDDSDCGEVCGKFKIGLVDIYLEEEDICRDSVDRTFREIVSWRIGSNFDGFLVTIHPWDLGEPIAWAIGTKEKGPALSELPIKFFTNPPSNWNDKKDPNLWINYVNLPACKP